MCNFAQGLKFKADFHSKMSVCRHELGLNPPAIPTLTKREKRNRETKETLQIPGKLVHSPVDTKPTT